MAELAPAFRVPPLKLNVAVEPVEAAVWLAVAARVRTAVEFGASRVLGPLGYEVRDKVLSERPEGFVGYPEAATRAGMDFSDYERVDDFELNEILWRAVKGVNAPLPPAVRRAIANRAARHLWMHLNRNSRLSLSRHFEDGENENHPFEDDHGELPPLFAISARGSVRSRFTRFC